MSVVNGLPAHILLVHAVVVLVPLAALAVAVVAWWPALRRRLGVLVPLLAVGAAALVPLTTSAGEWLEEHVQRTDLMERHTELGDRVLPWALGVAVMGVVVWVLGRLVDREQGPDVVRGAAVRIVVGVLAVVVGVGAVTAVVRAGDSGSRAAWQDRVDASAAVAGP